MFVLVCFSCVQKRCKATEHKEQSSAPPDQLLINQTAGVAQRLKNHTALHQQLPEVLQQLPESAAPSQTSADADVVLISVVFLCESFCRWK